MMAYICDRCGKPILRPEGDDVTRKVLYYGESDYDNPADGGELIALDVCESCWKSFKLFLTNFHPENIKEDE